MPPKPSYLVPRVFTEDYAKQSVDKIKEFSAGLQKWVSAHNDQINSTTRAGKLASIFGKNKQDKIAQLDKKKGSKLASYLENSYVTLAEFLGTLRSHLITLDQEMKGSYFMIVHANHDKGNAERPLLPKSSAWLAHTVTGVMGHKHALQGMMRVTDNRIMDIDKWPVGADRNLVYVDDGIYSGQQLLAFVISLAGFLWKSAKAFGTGGSGLTHLWIVVPYRTKRGQRVLDALASGKFIENLESELQTAEAMENTPDLSDAMAHGAKITDIVAIAQKFLRIHVVNKRTFSSITDTKEVFDKLGIKYNGMGAGLTVFEHKVPDAVSFPNALAKGALVRNGRLTLAYSNTRVPFVSQTDEKPYGKKRPGMMRHIIGSSDNMKIPYGLGHAYNKVKYNV